jgi:excisionase family DNA binding protein
MSSAGFFVFQPKGGFSMATTNKIYPKSKLFPELNPSLQFFSVAEVAIILGTSTRLVLEWVNQGLLRSFRVGPKGRLIRIRQKDLESFIDSHIRPGILSLSDQADDKPES